jgi:catechol 2,3-dioxygenase-like lactoylglutathione lyase family enzyme
MKFNTLIPELTVSDINKSKDFYINVLQFKVEYERPENNFVFISREGNQLMLKQDNGHWRTGDLVYPYGRGVNFEMTVFDVE